MSGNPVYYDTADATAYPQDIKNGQTAYARGEKVTGTQSYSISGDTFICPNDWYVVGDTLYIPDSWFEQNGG